MRSRPRLSALRRAAFCLAFGIGTSAVATREAAAYERQWHVGLDGGYALAAFPDANRSGFDGGLHATYGLTDAFNLRAHADVSGFALGDPTTRRLFTSGGLGAEYVIDILRWVPYVGVTVGPSVMLREGAPSVAHLGVEIPAGLGFQLSRSWTIGAEVRYRLLLLGDDAVSPSNGFVGLARAEFGWGS